MRFFNKSTIRPSRFVLIGDQLLIMFGLLSAILTNFRLLSINVFPLHTIFYRLTIHVGIAIIAWTVFKIYKKVIRFFSSKDYLNLIGILFIIHAASIAAGYLLPAKYYLKPEVFVISFFITSIYIIGSRFIIS